MKVHIGNMKMAVMAAMAFVLITLSFLLLREENLLSYSRLTNVKRKGEINDTLQNELSVNVENKHGVATESKQTLTVSLQSVNVENKHGVATESKQTLTESLQEFYAWFGSNRNSSDDNLRWRFSEMVTDSMIQKGSVTLPPLLSDFRNPCWIEVLPEDFSYHQSFYLAKDQFISSVVRFGFRSNMEVYRRRLHSGRPWRIRCYPYFLVLGISKCGTSDLHRSMKKHLMGLVSVGNKEPQYWEARRFGVPSWGSCMSGTGPKADFKDYLDLFDAPGEIMRKQLSTDVNYSRLVTGDFTPSTLWVMHKWQRVWGNKGLEEPRYTTAHHMHSLNPHTKHIIIMRDPVERAYSHYKARCPRLHDCSVTVPEFHDVVSTAQRALEECASIHGYRSCIYNCKIPGGSIVIPGFYYIFVSDWLKVFPRDQFIFLRFEDYTSNQGATLNKISQFLRLGPLSASRRNYLMSEASRTKPRTSNPAMAMWNTTRAILERLYAPWNAKLAGLLRDDRFLWDKS